MDSWLDVDNWTSEQLLRLLQIAIEQKALDQDRADVSDDPRFSLDVKGAPPHPPVSSCRNRPLSIRTDRQPGS